MSISSVGPRQTSSPFLCARETVVTESRWIISYDIANPKRLYRVAKALNAVGKRRQWSVFDCWLTPWAFAQLRLQIGSLIEVTADSVRFYRLTGFAEHGGLAPPAEYFIV